MQISTINKFVFQANQIETIKSRFMDFEKFIYLYKYVIAMVKRGDRQTHSSMQMVGLDRVRACANIRAEDELCAENESKREERKIGI